METVLSNAGGAGPQEFVAPRRTVATDDGDLGIGLSCGGGKVRQKIKQMGIVMKLLAGAVVTQKVIKLGECVVKVGIATAIDDVDALTGVSVEQA
jgi:hypothetical protein